MGAAEMMSSPRGEKHIAADPLAGPYQDELLAMMMDQEPRPCILLQAIAHALKVLCVRPRLPIRVLVTAVLACETEVPWVLQTQAQGPLVGLPCQGMLFHLQSPSAS